MDKRKAEILDAIINSYIDLPMPVGSRTISKEFDLGVSPATIRNEMADLEDLGYLNKPHTSAGRIPSDKAYRFYVDQIQQVKNLKLDVDQDLQKALFNKVNGLDDLFKNAAKMLADITNCTSYVISSKKPDTKIKFIELIGLVDYTVLLLIVGNKGVVEKEIINLDYIIPESDLKMISENLNKEIMGIDFEEVDRLKVTLTGDMAYHKEFISEIINRTSLFNQKISEVSLFYDGLTNILSYEEYWEVEKAREFMNFIESKSSILTMLTDLEIDNNIDVEVIVGSENIDKIMENNSIIRSTFRPKNRQIGQIGILGPMRMNYKKNIENVKIFSDNLAFAIDEIVGWEVNVWRKC